MDIFAEAARLKESEKFQKNRAKALGKLLIKRRKEAMRKTRPVDIDSVHMLTLPEITRRPRGVPPYAGDPRDAATGTPPVVATGTPAAVATGTPAAVATGTPFFPLGQEIPPHIRYAADIPYVTHVRLDTEHQQQQQARINVLPGYDLPPAPPLLTPPPPSPYNFRQRHPRQ